MSGEHLPTEAALVLGRYELADRIGMGASATVWRARDRVLGREVALKMLHAHLVADERARRRLRAEAESTRRLRHPGIVPLLDAHLQDAQPALVFEYVAGETLARRLAREGAVEPQAAAAIAGAVARALGHAHAAGLVHRDVKPSNVLLGADGSVRLLDLGISSPAGQSALTEAGTAVGTLPYMPPEQLAGRPADPASDVYALGAVIYEMLAGRPPYGATNALALAESQRTPPPLLEGPAQPLARVALAALAYTSESRPSAAELVAMIAAVAGPSGPPTETLAVATPTVAVPSAPALGLDEPRRRSALRIGAAAVPTAALVIGIALALPRFDSTPPEPVPAAVPTPSPAAADVEPLTPTDSGTAAPAQPAAREPAVRPASAAQPGPAPTTNDQPADRSQADNDGDEQKSDKGKGKKEKKEKKEKGDSGKGKGRTKGDGRGSD